VLVVSRFPDDPPGVLLQRELTCEVPYPEPASARALGRPPGLPLPRIVALSSSALARWHSTMAS
jgi:hypothetical protein